MSDAAPEGRLDAAAMAAVLARARAGQAPGSGDDAVVFYDLSRLEGRLAALAAAFPPGALHATAVKANPLVEVLKRVRDLGHGAESASLGELELALAAGFPPARIVYDSPVKTRDELAYALRTGVGINANSLDELARIAELRGTRSATGRIGLRVNPEIGAGAIAETSVAVARSKFGVSLKERRDAIVAAFAGHPWLTGLHVHIGSQGMSLDQLAAGVGAVYDLFVDLRRTTAVDTFNLGGGLPAPYRAADVPATYAAYVAALRARCPDLFAADVNLITEFGRSLHAGCGWVASRIEYVTEHADGTATLYVHVGADMFVRRAYRPDQWYHDLSVCDAGGRLRDGPARRTSVAGPLCFAGDYLARDVALPADVRPGDVLLIHDAGAYTFSMWSLYNSRPLPAVLGYESGGDRFHLLRPRQTTDDIVAFWSAEGEA